MAFNLATAKPVGAVADPSMSSSAQAPPSGFDLASAKPVGAAAKPATPIAPSGSVSSNANPYAYFDPTYRREHGIKDDPDVAAAAGGVAATLQDAAEDPIGTLNAIPAGFNKGAALLVGQLADAPANVIDLAGTGYGTAASLITGKPAGEFYEPLTRGSGGQGATGYGEHVANLMDAGSEAIGAGPVTTNPAPNNRAARLTYSAASAVPGAMTGRAAIANAAGGAAQDIVAEAGGDPAAQALAGMMGGHAAAARGAPRPIEPQSRVQVQPPVASEPPIAAAPTRRELTASGAARATPYTDLEGAATSKKPPRFVEETPVVDGGGSLGIGDQARRKDILRRVGVGELRNSAVQGDAKAAATDFQMSKLDSPQGQHMSRVLNSEREAVQNFAERIATETGGTRGTGQTENLQRGTNIIAPLDGIKDFYDNRTRALYKVADARAKGKPFDTKATREILADESEFLGTVEGEALLRGVRSRMKSLKMSDADGTPMRSTVQQAERMKQWLGDSWTPRTSRLVKKLKEAIDDDVARSAGEDVYGRARALRAERARILDDPQGIAKIMDAEGPQGINRAVSAERVGDVITTLPVAQFAHIVKTFNEAPAELRGPAQAALAEIKSHFANKVAEIGNKTQTQWNAKGVSKYLNDNSARLRVLFAPEELQRFADLNDAGHILRFDSSYPGAAVQSANLKRAAVVEHAVTAAGAAIGSSVGPLGTVAGAGVGKMIGDKFGRRMNERAGLKAARARTTDLRTEPTNALARPATPRLRNSLQGDE